MYLDVTGRAVVVLLIEIVGRSTRWNGAANIIAGRSVESAMAFQTELRNAAGPQQSGIRRPVGDVTRRATFRLYRCMFIREWSLLVGVAFDAGCIDTRR